MAIIWDRATYHKHLDEYENGPARSEIRVIHELIKPIRQRVVALDIEGTLASRTLPKYLEGKWRKKLFQWFVGDEFVWLRRPLAKHLIAALVEQNNRVLLWTVANMQTARMIMESAEIPMLKNVQIVAKEHTRKVLKSKKLHGQAFKIAGHNEKVVLTEKIKLPSLFGVDVLLDDQSDRWHRPFVEAVEPKNLRKVLQVPVFCPTNFAEIRAGIDERGVVNMAKLLSKRFAKKR